MRRLGSAALDLCFVACGRYDAYVELALYIYDIAAGMVILREAGGYRLEKFCPCDMFAQTVHVETVCLLSKLKDAKQHVEIEVSSEN